MIRGMVKRPQLPRVIFVVVVLSFGGIALTHIVRNDRLVGLVGIGMFVAIAGLWRHPGMQWARRRVGRSRR
jgi:hypothetical protein